MHSGLLNGQSSSWLTPSNSRIMCSSSLEPRREARGLWAPVPEARLSPSSLAPNPREVVRRGVLVCIQPVPQPC